MIIYSLAFVHDLFLSPDLHGRQFLHGLLVIAKTSGDFVVERVHEVFQRPAERLAEIVAVRRRHLHQAAAVVVVVGGSALCARRLVRRHRPTVQRDGRGGPAEHVVQLFRVRLTARVMVVRLFGGRRRWQLVVHHFRPLVRLLELRQRRFELEFGHFVHHIQHSSGIRLAGSTISGPREKNEKKENQRNTRTRATANKSATATQKTDRSRGHNGTECRTEQQPPPPNRRTNVWYGRPPLHSATVVRRDGARDRSAPPKRFT